MSSNWSKADTQRLQDIAESLMRFASSVGHPSPPDLQLFNWNDSTEPDKSDDSILLALAREEYASRELRAQFLPDEFLGEPAWDMLLDLFINEELGKRVSVTSACLASRVPTTTALRWLSILERRGYIQRSPDPSDQRRSFAGLTSLGRQKMKALLRKRVTAMSTRSEQILRLVAANKKS